MKRNSNGMPNVFWADEITRWSTHKKDSKGRWTAARPLGYAGLHLFKRAKIAWKVFIGQYDALRWDEE
jgi:hypothetical protein